MTCPALLALEDFRDTHRRTAMRQRWHDRFNRWLTQREECMQDPTPTVAELTQAVLALRQELPHAVTGGLVEPTHRVALEQRTAVCPPCGQTWAARGSQDRTVETLVGALRLRRPYVYGERCPFGTTPLDQALQLPQRRKPPDVQKAAVQLTNEIPYETACERFEALTGLPLRAHTAHDVPPAATAGGTSWMWLPAGRRASPRSPPSPREQPWRPILGLAMDGAEGPTRPAAAKGQRPGRPNARAKRARGTGEWRAAKGVRVSRLADDRSVQGLSWHQGHTDHEAAAACRQVKAAGLSPAQRVRLGVMADGARWLWKQAPARCPSAVESLAYYHCSEHRHKGAGRQYGAHPERQQAWYEAALARLFRGEAHGGI